jgi:hypothetical protein
MTNRPRNLAIAAVLGAAAVAAAFIAWSRSYRYEMRPVYAVIAAGEQGWAGDATRMLDGIISRSLDHHALAERLLTESDGSLVAEGMVLAVQSCHPQARSLVQQHLSDKRWNWSMANNAELAKQLLLQLDGKPVEEWVGSWLGRTATSTRAFARYDAYVWLGLTAAGLVSAIVALEWAINVGRPTVLGGFDVGPSGRGPDAG